MAYLSKALRRISVTPVLERNSALLPGNSPCEGSPIKQSGKVSTLRENQKSPQSTKASLSANSSDTVAGASTKTDS